MSICPISSNRYSNNPVECCKENCAWWLGEGCAVAYVGDNCKSAFENENANNGKELIEAWNTRAERTCHMNLVKDGSIFDVWKFDCCGFEFAESGCERGQTELPGTCCPNCGAKVVEE